MFHPRGPSFLELVRQGLSSTEQGYDLLASKFDYTPFRTPRWILDAIVPHLGRPGSVERALDLCCGTGAGIELLLPLCRERIVGVDRSCGMLREAAARFQRFGRVELVRADARQLPFRRTFDLATCFGALGHFLPADQEALVTSAAASLKRGGRLVLITGVLPSGLSWRYWAARGFNGIMRARNALISPPFIMYYLNFLLPRVKVLLEQNEFSVEVYQNVFPGRYGHGRLVVATLARGS